MPIIEIPKYWTSEIIAYDLTRTITSIKPSITGTGTWLLYASTQDGDDDWQEVTHQNWTSLTSGNQLRIKIIGSSGAVMTRLIVEYS